MSTRASLSETLNRLLPGEEWKRVREAILQGANYSGQRTDQLRQSIDQANRLRTGLLTNGTTTILTDISAELSGYVWVVNFAVKQPAGVSALVIDAPESSFARDDYFVGLEDGTIVYRPGTVDALGNSFPPVYNSATEVILRIVRRNPDGSNDEVEIPESNNLIDFAEQNIIPYVAGGKLKNSGIQVLFDALGAIAGFKFPTPVRGLPATEPDEFVTLSQLPTIQQYGLLNGGTIQWRGDGLWFKWAMAVVGIGGVLNAPSAEIELAPAHATLNREDLLGWLRVDETTAVPHVILGTPAPAFAPPPYDPSVFVVGIPVKIPAAATVPDGTITSENVYLDNAEWNVSSSGIGIADPDSTANPKTGTKAVELSAIRNNFRTIFDRGSVLDLNTFTDPTIGWDQALKAAMANNQNFDIIFLDGSGVAASNLLQVAINKASTAYQFIGINLDAFTFTTKLIRYIEIRYRQPGSGTHPGAFFDNIKIQGGVAQPPSNGSGVQSVTGDGVGGTPSNPVLTFPTPAAIGAQVALDANIVNALNASLVDSPGTLNRYVSVSLLNSYAYVQEAPINGNHYARKDGVWAAFTPFIVAGTPIDGHVVTSVVGVATWVAPSGGGGSVWTVAGADIYRNSKVTIGQATIINADLGIKQNNILGAIRIDSLPKSTRRDVLTLYEGDTTKRFSVDNYGIPIWKLWNGADEAGAISFTTPTGSVGVVVGPDETFPLASRGSIYWDTTSHICRITVNNTTRFTINNGFFGFNTPGSATQTFQIRGTGTQTILFNCINIAGTSGIFAVYNSGYAYAQNLRTANFTGSTSRDWKLGERKAAAVAFDSTQYLTVEVNGVVYNLALAL